MKKFSFKKNFKKGEIGKKSKSILIKMLAGILLPVVLILSASGIFLMGRVKNTVTALTDDKLMESSQKAAVEADKFFSSYIVMAEQLAANSKVNDFLKNTDNKAQRFQDNKEYSDILQALTDMAGVDSENIMFTWVGDDNTSQIMQNDKFTSAVNWDITSRPWYAAKEKGETMIVPPYEDLTTGKTVVSIVANVKDEKTGAIIGFAGIDILLDNLTNTFAEFTLGEEGFFILCSDDGTAVYHPESAYAGKKLAETNVSAEAVSAVNSQVQDVVEYTLDGKKIHGTVSAVGNTGWHVLTGLPDREYYGAITSIASQLVTTIVIEVIFAIVAVTLIAIGIVKPLKHLSQTANRIADGELDVDVVVKSMDEVGHVSDAIRQTVLRLKDYISYINEISDVLNEIADGNMDFELKQKYEGEFSKIRDALMNISTTLTATLRQINMAAEQVASGSDQVALGAQALSQGSIEQSSAVEELASTIAQISENVRMNADNAQKAKDYSDETSSEVAISSTKMNDMMGAISEISSKSTEIGKIIKTIEDIAFQTNILALNAAVEAARAGQAGKGFAVVADEVRNLASKSAEAAKNTTMLIEDTVKAVDNGTRIADETAKSMQAVVNSTGTVTDLIKKIADASKEQAVSIAEVTSGVDQVASIIQTNSATAEESAATAEELSGQAQMLKDLVGGFKLKA
ncbi:MAG: methyl-accepting chemotaxis protein [Anaerotignaceae bacterium]